MRLLSVKSLGQRTPVYDIRSGFIRLAQTQLMHFFRVPYGPGANSLLCCITYVLIEQVSIADVGRFLLSQSPRQLNYHKTILLFFVS